ncbi:MAG: hypothetical protein LBI03_06220, partial [Clostridiales bacterium]|nr:hypothetical protein [Clostridiales bacterium]
MEKMIRECFLIKEGKEQKAELEEILPLIDDWSIQYIFKCINDLERIDKFHIDLAYVLAHMSDENKDLIYRNMVQRIRRRVEKEVRDIESKCEKDHPRIQHERTELLSFIGRFKDGGLVTYLKPCIWKESVPSKKMPIKEQPNRSEKLIKIIEEACKSGNLKIGGYETHDMTEEEILNVFTVFQNRRGELQQIRSLTIPGNVLPAAALLFEPASIEELKIQGEFPGSWPSFLENYHALTSIELCFLKGLTEFPPWIRNSVLLRCLSIKGSDITVIPEWIGDLQSLTELSIGYHSKDLKTLPDSIGNLKNFVKFNLHYSPIETLPDCIGNLRNLTQLSLKGNSKLTTLPDWIGNLDNLVELELTYNENLKYLPDSMGKLKNLVKLELYGSPIENLPDTMVNCTSLEYVDICGTSIKEVPHFISTVKTFKQTIVLIPQERPVFYGSFCNCYYRLVETLLQFSRIARKEGLLALEDYLHCFSDDFFGRGMRLVIDGTDPEIIQHMLMIKIEREHDYYRKKLMEIAMEGISCIQWGVNTVHIALKLATIV